MQQFVGLQTQNMQEFEFTFLVIAYSVERKLVFLTLGLEKCKTTKEDSINSVCSK